MKLNPSRRRKRSGPNLTWAEGIRGLMGEKKTGMTETNGRRYYNCQMRAERCINVVKPAKYMNRKLLQEISL